MRNVTISTALVFSFFLSYPTSSFAVYDPVTESSYLDVFPKETAIDKSDRPNYIRYYANSWMKKEMKKSTLLKSCNKEKEQRKFNFFQKIAAWFGFL